MTEKCTARNGSYVCQYELSEGRHSGVHYAYFITGDGQARIAYWIDQFGKVRSVKAPVPGIAR